MNNSKSRFFSNIYLSNPYCIYSLIINGSLVSMVVYTTLCILYAMALINSKFL